MNKSSLQLPERAFILINLSNRLSDRSKRSGSTKDLERSVTLAFEAQELLPVDNANRGYCLKHLGHHLSHRYDKNGSEEDLDRAVGFLSEASKLVPTNRPDRANCLSLLAGTLMKRYLRTGSFEDLDHAIKIADEAVNEIQPSHGDRVSHLKELKYFLGYKAAQDKSIAGINQLIKVNKELVHLIPADHPDHALCLSDAGEILYTRFHQTESAQDIKQAIQMVDDAVVLTPLDDPIRAYRLSLVSYFLSRCYKFTKSMVDLDRAIEVAQKALENTELDAPNRLAILNILGSVLTVKVEQTMSVDDIKPFLSLFEDGWDCPKAPTTQRILSAELAVYLLDLDSDWEGSSMLMERAVHLLPFVSPRSLKHANRQDRLKIHSGLPSRAAAYSLRDHREPSDALRILEFGRGIVASSLMDLRGDVSHLEKQHPQLAAEFIMLRDRLDLPADDVAPWEASKALYTESEQKKRRDADIRLSEILEEIRTQPGFSEFLFPLGEEAIKTTADLGPLIVVTVDNFRCDAFLVERHQIRVLHLHDLTLEDVHNHVRRLQMSRFSVPYLSSMLEWLWNTIAGPCLDALGYNNTVVDDNWPHVWWIPTGPLSHLPLHAAGLHRKGSTDTVLDRVISSYAPSLKALAHGRQQAHHMLRESKPGSALLVTMSNTPSRSPLHYAVEETSVLEALCQSLQLKAMRLQQQTRKEVLDQIGGSTIFHFAGHGYSDPSEPSQSTLLLEDWQRSPLTLGHLRDLHLNQTGPFLAYLSACSTGANKAEDLDDEGISIISACQLAGFRHVIGTLWEVSDRVCVDIARSVYETLRDEGMTDVAVARGLHLATKALRDQSLNRDSIGGNSTALSTGTQEVGSQAGRDGTLLSSKNHKKELVNLSWIPYMHYGA